MNLSYKKRNVKMNFTNIIETKRDGGKLTDEEISFFVSGVADKSIPDYMTAAFLMACFIRGLDDEETAILTREMAYTGDRIVLPDLGGAIVDKHSSGGVGDKTTLVIAPLTAACGLKVAKMSGRGLGYSGGTLDKLESIPGFRVNLDQNEFISYVIKDGISVMGQTASLAPVDKVLYSLRDVTATVPSIPLIASSIMSKKLAVGSDAIVLDVKYGDGAFMKNIGDAEKLADKMVAIGKENNRRTYALLTNMEQPLGYSVGNSLEVIEAVDTLKGRGPEDFTELCMAVASVMLIAGKIAANEAEASSMLKEALDSKRAFEKLRRMVINQGGDVSYIDDTSKFPQAASVTEVYADKCGYISGLSAEVIGRAAVDLGAGRYKKEDGIDHSAGIVLCRKIGDEVKDGDVLCRVFCSERRAKIEGYIKSAFIISDEKPEMPKVVEKVIGI